MKKKVLLITLALLLLAGAAGGIWIYRSWSKYQALDPGSESDDVEKLYPGPWTDPPGESADEDELAEDPEKDESMAGPGEETASGQRIHFLLLGLDGGERLADVVMVVTLDTGSKSGRVISIPRDTLAYIPGKGRDGKCKITEIYWYGGGRDVMLENVKRLSGISPHYYAEVTFGGFQSIVDALGGITVNGQRMSGSSALKVARDRSGGDDSRIHNQQQVMMGMLRAIGNVHEFSQVSSLISTGLGNVRTNMGFTEAIDLYKSAGAMDPANTSYYTISHSWEMIDGVWYCVP